MAFTVEPKGKVYYRQVVESVNRFTDSTIPPCRNVVCIPQSLIFKMTAENYQKCMG